MTAADVKTIVLVRVTINDSLFVLCAISLSVCLYKVAKMSLANIYLESKVKSGWQRQWVSVDDWNKQGLNSSKICFYGLTDPIVRFFLWPSKTTDSTCSTFTAHKKLLYVFPDWIKIKPLCSGDVSVSGDSDWYHGGVAVCVSSLLQPGCARPHRHRDHQLLWLRLV